MCPGCGQLKAHAWDEESDGHWERVNDVTCYACAAEQRAANDDREAKREVPPGELSYLVFNREDFERAKRVKARRRASAATP